MTKDEIRKRCRKVFIHVTDNRIFEYGSGEYDFISVFREQETAEQTLSAKNGIAYEWEKGKQQTTKVVGFYLVPIVKLD